MCQYRFIAVAMLAACAAPTNTETDDKRSLADYDSVKVSSDGSRPARLSSGSALEQHHSFTIVASQPSDSELEIKSSELILAVPAQQSALRLSMPWMWNDYAMQIGIRAAGTDAEFRELNTAKDGYFTEILLDRALGAFSGTIRRFSQDEESIGEPFAVPQPELRESAGDIELRIRMVPVDTWGDIGVAGLVFQRDADYYPTLSILDAEQELIFDEVNIESLRAADGASVVRRLTGHYQQNQHRLVVELGFIDLDGDLEPDPESPMSLRVESTEDGSVYRADISVEERSDGVFYAYDADSESDLPTDREGLRYLISYQLNDGLDDFRRHETREDLWDVPTERFRSCLGWGGGISVGASGIWFVVLALGNPVGAAFGVAMVTTLSALLAATVAICSVRAVVQAGGILLTQPL